MGTLRPCVILGMDACQEVTEGGGRVLQDSKS